MFTDSQFLFETFILCLIPLPLNPAKGYLSPTFSMTTQNWIDYGTAFERHTTEYVIPYLTSDIFLAAMTFRVYFILKAVTAYSPMNHLFGRRVCYEAGFEADFLFLLRVGMQKYPVRIYGCMCACFVFVFASIVRVFERPYYTFVLEPPTYDFKDLYSSVWFTVMTMLEAGYGDIVPATPVGRVMSIITVISGAIIVALLIALVIDAYQMDEVKVTATAEIVEKQLAVQACRHALELNVLKRKRYRMLRERDESEYLPQPEDIRHKRDIMEFAIAQLREKRLQNLSAKRVATRDVQMSLIKEQVLDL